MNKLKLAAWYVASTPEIDIFMSAIVAWVVS